MRIIVHDFKAPDMNYVVG